MTATVNHDVQVNPSQIHLEIPFNTHFNNSKS